MKEILYWLKSEESGQGLLEYALIIGFASIAAFVVLGIFGGKINILLTRASDNFS